MFRLHDNAGVPIEFTCIYVVGSCIAKVPGYAKAPLCTVGLYQSKRRVYFPHTKLTLYVTALGVVSPNGNATAHAEDIPRLDYFWRAAQIVLQLGPYEPVTEETLKACFWSVSVDQDPKNKHARPWIEWAVNRVGEYTYRQILKAAAPEQITQLNQRLKKEFWAEIARRDGYRRGSFKKDKRIPFPFNRDG